MDNATLLAIIRSHRDNSLGFENGELSTERAKALDHYHGRPYGNEIEGRSQVVDRSLMEAVDWAMPHLMRVFIQAGILAEFRPLGPDDEELASQESDYVNLVMMQDNDGFMVLHDAIKDTLLLKNGYTKQLWVEEEQIREESYEGMTMDQVALTMDTLKRRGAIDIEILGSECRQAFVPVPPQMSQQPMGMAQPLSVPLEVWDIKLKITRKSGKATWLAVPSEEIRVSKKCRGSLQDSPFTEHVSKKTRSELIEMGMDQTWVYTLASYVDRLHDSEQYARDTTSDESTDTGPALEDRSMDEIQYCEAYIKVDWDGDGVAELRKVVTCADQIPPGEEWNEPIPEVPVTGWAVKRVPHRHVGESLDDELADLQEILTTLNRQLLDNIYRINNAEMAINENANLRDFLTSTPGGVKRIKGTDPVGNSFQPIVTAQIINQILPAIDAIDAKKQRRSGIDGGNSGVDPDVLQEITKGAFMENLRRLGAKLEMMARLLAETGVKDAVLQMHGLLMRHQDISRMVQIRGKWVEVNPQEWKERTDLAIKVGLGTGTEEDKREKLGALTQLQGGLFQLLMSGAPPVIYAKAYASFEDTAKTLGFEMPEKYAVAANSQEYMQLMQSIQQMHQAQQGQGPGGDLSQAAQIQGNAQMQIQLAKNQAQAQVSQAKQQFDFAVADMQAQNKRDMDMMQTRFDMMNKDADRKLEMALEHMRQVFTSARQQDAQMHDDARAAMTQEANLAIHGEFADLGAPGISAGVQNSPGTNTIVSLNQPNAPANGGGSVA